MPEGERPHEAAAQAIRAALRQVRWRPNKADQHLAKRKRMGHLATGATSEDYHSIVRTVLSEAKNPVYRYPFGMRDYYAVAGQAEGVAWLVIFGGDGVLETAFPPRELARYLTTRGFVMLGSLQEIPHE